MRKSVFLIFIVFLSLVIFGNFSNSQELSFKSSLWIAPPLNFTEFKNIEKTLENYLKIYFSSSKYYEVTEEKSSAKFFLKSEILSIKILKNQCFIDINVKFIDSDTLETLYELTIRGTSGEKLKEVKQEDALLSEAINDATNKIVKEIEKISNLTGSVEFIKETGEIVINLTSSHGIEKGTKIAVIRNGEKIAEGIVKNSGILSSEVKITSYKSKPHLKDKVKILSLEKSKEPVKKKFLKKKLNRTFLALTGVGILALIANQGKEKEKPTSSSEEVVSPAASIDLIANTTSIPADGTTKIILTALVKNSNNVAVPDGTQVKFITTRGTIILPGGTSYTVTSSGKATAYLLSTEIGTATVKAKSGSVESNSLTVTFTPPPSLTASIDLISSENPIYIDSATGQATAIITAVLKQTDGNPVPDGTEVYFETDKGSITGRSTTTNGIAVATFSSSLTGNVTITAISGGIKTHLPLTVNPGPPHNIFVEVYPSSIEANGQSSSTVKVTVRDISGNLVMDGTEVDFLHPDSLNAGEVKVVTQTGVTGLATITPVSYTNGGVAQAILIGRDPKTGNPSISGTAIIKIRIPKNQPAGISSPSTDIYHEETRICLVSRQAAFIDVGAEPSNIRGLDRINITSTITALVYDQYHNPVADGTAVYFTTDHGMIEGDGETINRVATSTTKSGIATATISSSGSITEGIPGNPVNMPYGSWSWDGNVHVTVSCGNVTYNPGDPKNPSSYPFTTLIFSGPANQHISFVSSPRDINGDRDLEDPGEELDGTQKDSAVIVVQAIDINGHPVVDGTEVTFSTSKGKISPTTTTTKGGVAEATLVTKEVDSDEPVSPGRGVVTVKIDTLLYNPVILSLPFIVK